MWKGGPNGEVLLCSAAILLRAPCDTPFKGCLRQGGILRYLVVLHLQNPDSDDDTVRP